MLWWRAHHGLPSHPKWLQVARKSGQSIPVVFSVAMWLLDHASRSAERGSVSNFDPGSCAAFLWIDEADVSTVVSTLEAVGWLKDGAIATWNERQPLKEDPDATERKREQRKRDAEARKIAEEAETARGGTVTEDASHDVTQCHDESPQSRAEQSREEELALSLGARKRERSREDLDHLDRLLRQAGKFESSSKPGFLNLAPILGLLDQGLSLEEDILPVIRARTHPGVGSYSYFTKAILDARATRAAAAAGRGNALARASPAQGSPDRPTRGLASAHAGIQAVLDRRGAA